jgi:hypothetical protein
VYEVLIAAPNIILNSTFGLQEGLTLGSGVLYSDRDKELTLPGSGDTRRPMLATAIPITPYSSVEVTACVYESYNTGTFFVEDQDNQLLGSINFGDISYVTRHSNIAGQYYPTAYLTYRGHYRIKEIVLL